MAENQVLRVPTVHVQGGSAIRRPLMVLAICAVGVIAYLARDFLIPTAAAIILALILTPVAKRLERLHLRPTAAAAASVSLLAVVVAGLLVVATPALTSWAEQAPYLTYTLERKLEGLRKSLAIVKQVTDRVEQATQAQPSATATEKAPPEKVVVRDKSLLSELMSTTPALLLQMGYAGVLAFMLLAHRNDHKRQILRVPINFHVRVRLARVMRDINDRVGSYLFALVVIYSLVALASTIVLALLGFPNPLLWGVLMGLASFVPFVGPPVAIGLVALIALITYDDLMHMLAAPLILAAIHFVESQLPVRSQYRGGVCRSGISWLDVGSCGGDRRGPAAHPREHCCGTSPVAALALGALVGRSPGQRTAGRQAARRLGAAASVAAPPRGREITQSQQAPESTNDRRGAGRIELALEERIGGEGKAHGADADRECCSDRQERAVERVLGGGAQRTGRGSACRDPEQGADHGRFRFLCGPYDSGRRRATADDKASLRGSRYRRPRRGS